MLRHQQVSMHSQCTLSALSCDPSHSVHNYAHKSINRTNQKSLIRGFEEYREGLTPFVPLGVVATTNTVVEKSTEAQYLYFQFAPINPIRFVYIPINPSFNKVRDTNSSTCVFQIRLGIAPPDQ